jgi:hypothetical protein
MSRTEVTEKARDLTVRVLGQQKSDRLLETVYAIETVTSIRSLRPLLQPA